MANLCKFFDIDMNNMDTNFYKGVIPALMTPCQQDGTPNFVALLQKAESLMQEGMSAVVYCGSMGDWPLLSEESTLY